MAGPSTKPYSVSELKAKLMKPALTSHYICNFTPPPDVQKWLEFRGPSKFSGEIFNPENDELFQLHCSDASLPGSTLTTNSINDDYYGVSEKHVYRRLYDESAQFTFYVDSNYKIISFFEGWMSYIVGEEGGEGRLDDLNYFYRVRFPKSYKTRYLYITKFERDTGRPNAGGSLQYQFINAYPISINSMPVSYEQSQLLKCTVAFSYERYIINKIPGYKVPIAVKNPAAPGNPEIPKTSTRGFDPTSVEKIGRVITNEYYNNGISGSGFNQRQSPGNPNLDATNFGRGIA